MQEEKNTELKVVNEKSAGQKQRLASIELLRVLCIVMVIFNHTLNFLYHDGAGANFARYVNFINICAVGTFFVITGYFLFDGKFSYGKRLKKLVTQVIIPWLFTLIFIVCYRTVFKAIEGQSVGEFLKNELRLVIKQVLQWGFSDDYGYLWFVLVYTEIIVLYPVWYLLCKEDRPAVIARRLVMALCTVSLFFGDLQHIYRSNWSIRVFTLINPYILFLLIGYEIKRLRVEEKLNGKKWLILGLAAYLSGVGIGMSLMTLDVNLYGEFSWYWYYLEHIPSVISAVGLFVVFLQIRIRGGKPLYFAAKSVFYVYLLQSPIHVFFQRFQVTTLLFPYVGVLGYIVVFLSVTVISFALGMGIMALQTVIERAVKNKGKEEKRVELQD